MPTVASANRPSGSSAACTTCATVATSKRASPPPTSLPRSMSTTPNSRSPRARAASSAGSAARTRATATARTETAPCRAGTSPSPVPRSASFRSGCRLVPSRPQRALRRREAFALIGRQMGQRQVQVAQPREREWIGREPAALEVGKHPRHDQVRIGRREQRAREAACTSVHVGEQAAATLEVVDGAPVERVTPRRRRGSRPSRGSARAFQRRAPAHPRGGRPPSSRAQA